ncbi:ferric-chelate reductase [Bisporella sp. PMI_857]|nr:ferric-chelate reductase [Bisporella sp. PMI_857]
MPLFAGPHLSLLADLLGMTLAKLRQIHRSMGMISLLLALVHVLITLSSQPSFTLALPENRFAVTAIAVLSSVVFFSFPLFRRPWFELYLRTHQALAFLSVYFIWRHIPSDKRVYLYISIGMFLFMITMQVITILFRDEFFRYGLARVHITEEYGVVRVRLLLQKDLEMEAGQTINLWLPFFIFPSFLQTHPFVVISWAEGPQNHLDLFIQPRRGLTRDLLYHARTRQPQDTDPLVFFSGPHGKSAPINKYENILMVASDFGIAALLPYLKELLHGYNAREVRARRVHLVWQVQSLDITKAAEQLLNSALNEDTLDDGRILNISIYCEGKDIPTTPFGKRAKVYPRKASLQTIFDRELHIENKLVPIVDWEPETEKEKELELEGLDKRNGTMLVIVSAIDDIRDEMQRIVRDYLTDGVSLFEPDYQPSL